MIGRKSALGSRSTTYLSLPQIQCSSMTSGSDCLLLDKIFFCVGLGELSQPQHNDLISTCIALPLRKHYSMRCHAYLARSRSTGTTAGISLTRRGKYSCVFTMAPETTQGRQEAIHSHPKVPKYNYFITFGNKRVGSPLPFLVFYKYLE